MSCPCPGGRKAPLNCIFMISTVMKINGRGRKGLPEPLRPGSGQGEPLAEGADPLPEFFIGRVGGIPHILNFSVLLLRIRTDAANDGGVIRELLKTACYRSCS